MAIGGDDEDDDDKIGVVVAAVDESSSFKVLSTSMSADFSTFCSVLTISSTIAMVELTSVIGTLETGTGLIETGLSDVEGRVDVGEFAVTGMTSASPALANVSSIGAEIVFTAFRSDGRGVRVRRIRLVVVGTVDVVVVVDGVV